MNNKSSVRLHTKSGGCVDIEWLVLGPIENNVYIISDSISTFVVDPSCNVAHIQEALGSRNLDAIILTHCHFDHIGAAYELRKATGAPVIASSIDGPYIEKQELIAQDFRKTQACTVDNKVNNNDVLEIGSMGWKVLLTPGHTPGSMCLYIASEFGNHQQGAPVLISGDTLFYASIGRTDLERGSMDDMRLSLKKLAMLPDETIVLPGHDRLTTIGEERMRVFALYAR
jgi:glyoxylase-like metal-dependent hydrolase (beta-lactamase superfamily II)